MNVFSDAQNGAHGTESVDKTVTSVGPTGFGAQYQAINRGVLHIIERNRL